MGLIRDREKRGEGVWRWGERETNIKMGSDESHFNVSVGSDGQSHKAVSTNHNLSEEKGEPERYRTAGIKMEGLLYLQKYGIGGPEFGIKEKVCNRIGKAALPCPCLLSTARPTDRR